MNNEINLGLKQQLPYIIHNCSSIRVMLGEIYLELRYAWQRAWKGYDNIDVFSFNTQFRDRMIVCLEEIKESKWGLLNVPNRYKDDDIPGIKRNDTGCFTEEETNHILETIIYHLRMSDEDNVEKELYGTNCYDDDYDCHNITIDRIKNIEEERQANQDKAFDLLKMFWNQLYN